LRNTIYEPASSFPASPKASRRLLLDAECPVDRKTSSLDLVLTLVYAFLTSLTLFLVNIANVSAKFSEVASSRVFASLTLGAGQVLLGLIYQDYLSMLLAGVLSQLVCVLCLFRCTREKLKEMWGGMKFKLPSVSDVKLSAASVFSGGTLSMATSFPPVFMFSLGYVYEAGMVAVLQRFMLAPVNLIAAPISQTFIYYLKNNERLNGGRFAFFVLVAFLLVFSLFLFVASVLAEFRVFEILLGDEWGGVDGFAVYVSVLYASILVRNVVSQYFLVREYQIALVAIDLAFVLLVGGLYVTASFLGLSYIGFLQGLGFSYFVYALAPIMVGLIKENVNEKDSVLGSVATTGARRFDM